MKDLQESTASNVQFFLAHIIFDQEHGPLLKSFKSDNIEIPKIILQGVTTTLFTMAVGVGEPTGEPDTAIIPINVTGIQGRVLIHSFSIDDPSVRGKNRIESFMLFIPRSHQDKLLQHSYAFTNILQNAIHDILRTSATSYGVPVNFMIEKISSELRSKYKVEIYETFQNFLAGMTCRFDNDVLLYCIRQKGRCPRG